MPMRCRRRALIPPLRFTIVKTFSAPISHGDPRLEVLFPPLLQISELLSELLPDLSLQ